MHILHYPLLLVTNYTSNAGLILMLLHSSDNATSAILGTLFITAVRNVLCLY